MAISSRITFFSVVEILEANGRPQQMGQMLDRLFGEFRQDVGVIGGVFLAGEGVIVGADFIEDAVDVFPGVFGWSL